MRVFRKIILVAGILAVILLAGTALLGRIFEDTLTRHIIEGINRRVNTEIKVGDIKLSFVKKFPDASLEFREVFVASMDTPQRDTLLFADRIFLQFNPISLMKRQYKIREVQVRSGRLNVYIDPEGNGNYRIWEKTEKEKERDFLLDLENVRLTDIDVDFQNQALEINVRAGIRKSRLRGQFSQEAFSMSAGFEGMVHAYRNKGIDFLQQQDVTASADMYIDPASIQISEGGLSLAGQELKLSGTILRPAPLDLDLLIEGKRLDLENILRNLYARSDRIPGNLRAGGDLDFQGSVKGVASNTRMPGISADFSLRDGWMQTSGLPEKIREIRADGSYSNGLRRGPETTSIRLNGVSMRFRNSRMGGDYSVVNLIRPDFNYRIKADLDLGDWNALLPADTILEEMQGRVQADLSVKGDKALLADPGKSDFLGYAYKGDIYLEKVSLKFRKIPLGFSDFSGSIIFADHLGIQNLSGVFGDSQVSISGRVDNFLEYLLTPRGNLWMDIDLYSEKVDLNQLRSLNAKGTSKAEKDTVFLPQRLFLKSRFWFDELEYRNFSAKQVTGDLTYQPRRLSINSLEMNSMNGRIKSGGMLEQQGDMKFLVKSSSQISSVDITRAFASFDNFGQQFILDKHIKGSLTGMVNFSTGLNERFRIRKETVLADCDVSISSGELIGFEPMMELSRFIDIEELENVKFSTLTNEIFIRNEEVVIPKMDIHSSAVDITASGNHGFDKYFTYKVKVSLSEILAQKSGKSLRQESEFGVIEDDGLAKVYVYLIVEGTPEEITVRYDRRGAVENIREQMKEENRELKQLFREEFGLFRKDTTLEDSVRDRDAPGFIIQWDEREDSAGVKAPGRDNNSQKERFIIQWDEDDTPVDTSIAEPERKRRRKK